jgi:hypothetical protein
MAKLELQLILFGIEVPDPWERGTVPHRIKAGRAGERKRWKNETNSPAIGNWIAGIRAQSIC